jgi:hypothetical protein
MRNVFQNININVHIKINIQEDNMEKYDSTKKKIISLIESASKEQLDKITFGINFIINASPEEKDELLKQIDENEDFDIHAWIESKRPLLLSEGV